MVFAEDLNLKATSCGMLARHCLDPAWGSFLETLKWVCWKRGVYFAKVDPNGTSQICPQCGTHTGKKELSESVNIPSCVTIQKIQVEIGSFMNQKSEIRGILKINPIGVCLYHEFTTFSNHCFTSTS
jgi:hypothetical protein